MIKSSLRAERWLRYQRKNRDPTMAPKAAQMPIATAYQVATNATESTGQYMA
jgi:hypothetical protein